MALSWFSTGAAHEQSWFRSAVRRGSADSDRVRNSCRRPTGPSALSVCRPRYRRAKPGVPSDALLEITPGGLYTEGPGVAGWIRNQFAAYGFNGRLFGGFEGFVSLVELRTGERIDRLWIGLSQAGLTLRTEDSAIYTFQCRE